jgi:solute carrier family 25 2-oxodicarboxylate transporter 21
MNSLYQGMESTFWRHVWWNAGYFGCIYWTKSLLPKPTVSISPHIHSPYELTSQTKTQEITNNLVAGTVGGFAGTALNTPCQFPIRL